MNITSKSRYALKILLDIGEHQGESDLVQRADISARQGIPLEYMDQVLGRLRDGGLVVSTRGRGGGYRLARAADTVSMLDIFTVVEDAFEPVQCLDGGTTPCVASHNCSSRDAWHVISGAIRQSLSGIILSGMIPQRKAHPLPGESAQSLREAPRAECRAPRRRGGAVEQRL